MNKNKFSAIDGIAILFFLGGGLFVILGTTAQLINIGWILIVIGIVKQLIEWK